MIVGALAEHGLNTPDHRRRLRPHRHREALRPRRASSARDLDADRARRASTRTQVYRIDHYLGKETVQNVLALRFANAIFEPIWNRRYVDHVQITVAESLGVGHRGSFYEQAGALRDIVQNHVMQVLALTLMEPPATFDADGIRDEKVKALRAVDILHARGGGHRRGAGASTRSGWVEGEEVPGYRDEEGVDPHSQTETYVAMRLKVDNWRWAGVPVLRPHRQAPAQAGHRGGHGVPTPCPTCRSPPARPRASTPTPSCCASSPTRASPCASAPRCPGQAFRVRSVSMDFFYGAAFLEETPEAYERLLLDALVGDPTLFIRTDEVEQAWRIVDPILKAWEDGDVPLAPLRGRHVGPARGRRAARRDGRRWRRP